ncbi:MAG: hypothetical protein KKH98_11245, partial [Spirochaetes bacterium]|nr:hypothetical protein [Spirochaetota bacterium]
MKINSTLKNQNLLRSGVYMGGIGAGGFEVRPNGEFHRCRIFNHWREEIPLDAFFLHKHKNKTRILRLNDLVTSGRVVQC